MRPAVIVAVVLGAVVLALCAAVALNANSLQYQQGQLNVSARVWRSCTKDQSARSCAAQTRAVKKQVLAEAHTWRVEAGVTARDGTLVGSLEYAARALALALGAVLAIWLAALTVASEWPRRTVGLVGLGLGRHSVGRVIARRAFLVFMMVCMSGIAGAIMTLIVASLTTSVWPLPTVPHLHHTFRSLVVPLSAIVFYSATAVALAAALKSVTRTVIVGAAGLLCLMFSTSLGSWAPGSWLPAVAGTLTRNRLDIGLYWNWPIHYLNSISLEDVWRVATVKWWWAAALLLTAGGLSLAAVARPRRRPRT
jgi:hypothetical protein